MIEPWALAAAGVGTVFLLGGVYLFAVLFQRIADWAAGKRGKKG